MESEEGWRLNRLHREQFLKRHPREEIILDEMRKVKISLIWTIQVFFKLSITQKINIFIQISNLIYEFYNIKIYKQCQILSSFADEALL